VTCSRPDTPRKGASRQEKLRSLQQRRSALHAANRPALQPSASAPYGPPCGQENVPVQLHDAAGKGLGDMHAKGLDEDSLEDALTRASAVLQRSSALIGAAGVPPPAKVEDASQDMRDLSKPSIPTRLP
jgi:hypothetical protein